MISFGWMVNVLHAVLACLGREFVAGRQLPIDLGLLNVRSARWTRFHLAIRHNGSS